MVDRNINKIEYRPEIDGIRALAIIAVIINHFNKNLLPNGYLGLDIFFVISGFVITSSLAKRKSLDFLQFISGFYKRRIKRIFPALIFFVLIFSILICFFNQYPGESLQTGIASFFGLSNIYLLQSSTDYFASEKGEYSYINKRLRKIEGEEKNIFLFDALSLMCPDKVCIYKKKNTLLYFDEDHLSNYAALNIIAPEMLYFLNKNNILFR